MSMRQRLKETEADFASWVEGMFEQFGFEFSHTYEQRVYARRSTIGFYDYVAIKVPRFLLVELKSETGKVSPEQRYWLDMGSQIEVVETYIWRTSDRPEIEQIILLGHVPNLIERQMFKTTWHPE